MINGVGRLIVQGKCSSDEVVACALLIGSSATQLLTPVDASNPQGSHRRHCLISSYLLDTIFICQMKRPVLPLSTPP